MVTLYSTPTCAPCRVAEKRLHTAGVPFEKIDLTAEPATLQALKDRLGVPQVQTPLIEYRDELHTIASLSAIIATIQADA